MLYDCIMQNIDPSFFLFELNVLVSRIIEFFERNISSLLSRFESYNYSIERAQFRFRA